MRNEKNKRVRSKEHKHKNKRKGKIEDVKVPLERKRSSG
jgi:hypothetical protein